MDDTPPTDLRPLLARCALGDRDALGALYRAASPKLFAVALRILRDADRAEDALQDAFLRIWRRAGDYDPARGAPVSWMASIVHNLCIDEVRRSGRSPVRLDALAPIALDLAPSPDPGPVEEAEHDREARALLDCLSSLRAEQRDVIVRAYLDGLTHVEAARVTGTPVGTVKTWIRRGLASLRECLER